MFFTGFYDLMWVVEGWLGDVVDPSVVDVPLPVYLLSHLY